MRKYRQIYVYPATESEVKISGIDKDYDWNSVTFLDGHKAEMKVEYVEFLLLRIKDIKLRIIVIKVMKNVT